MSEPYTEDRLRAAIASVKEVAGGPIDPLWDCIDDAEALLANKPTVLTGSREELVKRLTDILERYRKVRSSSYQKFYRDAIRGAN